MSALEDKIAYLKSMMVELDQTCAKGMAHDPDATRRIALSAQYQKLGAERNCLITDIFSLSQQRTEMLEKLIAKSKTPEPSAEVDTRLT